MIHRMWIAKPSPGVCSRARSTPGASAFGWKGMELIVERSKRLQRLDPVMPARRRRLAGAVRGSETDCGLKVARFAVGTREGRLV